VDTEGFVLKAKVHSAKVMDYEGIKTLLEHAGQAFPRLSLICGWRRATVARRRVQTGSGRLWAGVWISSSDLVERARKAVPEEVLMRWAREWAKEGVAR
jgi:hypothetical protein